MINWQQVTGFNWDTGNEQKSAEKHSVSRFEAEQVFFNQPLLVLIDVKHSQNEARYHALGKANTGRLLHISFTLRADNTLIRIISARVMHSKERASYEKNEDDS